MTENALEKIVALFMARQDKINTNILNKIGSTIKTIGAMTPTQIQQIRQMYTYGADIDEIAHILSVVSQKNKQDIYNIFKNVAESDYADAKYLYDAQGLAQIPYKDSKELQRVVKAIYDTTSGAMSDLSRTKAIGFVDKDGHFKNIYDTYNDVVDKAVQTISTIGHDYQREMYSYLRQLGSSGVRAVYESNGKQITRRIDTVMRMHILDGVRDISQAVQEQIGVETGANGVEISAHLSCAPDHLPYQGLQYSHADFDKLQDSLKRRIGEYNCRHIYMSIILGVSEPAYSPEELEEIRKNQSEKSIEYEGKKYTQYEATQLQRKLETKIRQHKDQYILARVAGNEQLMNDVNRNLNVTRKRYREFSKIAKLPQSRDRTRVAGFRKS